MASATQSLTTYYAKRIIGDTAAADETSALLQTGAGVATDTWILHRTNRNKLYGIKYLYDNSSGGKADKIELYGDDASTAWVELDTGDVYIMGKVGIGYDPNTTGNLYKLYVDGNVYFDDTTYLNGNVGIGYDPATSGNTYKLYVDGDIYADDTTYLNGKVGIGYDPNTTGNTCKLYVNGTLLATSYITSGIEGSNGSTSQTGLVAATTGGRIVLFMNPDDTNSERTCGLWVTAHGTGTDKNILLVDTNNNTTFYGTLTGTADYATSLYKRFSLVKGTNPSATTWLSNWFNYQSGNGVEVTDRIGGGIESCIDANGTSRLCLRAYQYTASSSNHNTLEVRCASDGTQSIAISGLVNITNNGNTLTIGSQNASCCHIESSADIPFWFNRTIYMQKGTTIGAAGTAYRPFQLYLGRNTTSGSNALNASSPLIEFSNSDRSQYCQLIYDDWDSIVAPDSLTLVGNQNGIKFILKNGPLWIQGGSNAGGNINRLETSSGMPGNMQYNQSRRGTQIYANGIAFADPYNGNSNSDAGWIRHLETTGNSGTLEIGVGDDGNETIVARQYKTDNTVNRTLTLLDGSGNSSFPGNITLPSGGRLGKASGNMYIGDSGNSGWVLTQDICSHTSAGDSYWSARANGTGHFKTVYGAVWNDYAEMRNVPKAQTDIHRIYDDKGEVDRDYPYAGYCVYEIGNGEMEITDQRLMKGCKIISDTFGFCIGETENCCTPIAVTGRVLAYPYENIEEFKEHIGDCVCSGPNGTISIMTQEEKIKHPECIVGTISEIPNYDVWYCGNKLTKPIDVNGRIWIYVK